MNTMQLLHAEARADEIDRRASEQYEAHTGRRARGWNAAPAAGRTPDQVRRPMRRGGAVVLATGVLAVLLSGVAAGPAVARALVPTQPTVTTATPSPESGPVPRVRRTSEVAPQRVHGTSHPR